MGVWFVLAGFTDPVLPTPTLTAGPNRQIFFLDPGRKQTNCVCFLQGTFGAKIEDLVLACGLVDGGPTYRGTSLTGNSTPLGPYSSNMPRALALWRSSGGGLFLMSEVPL